MNLLTSMIAKMDIAIKIFIFFVISIWLFFGVLISTTSVRSIDDTRTVLADIANTAVSAAAKNKTTNRDPADKAEEVLREQLRTITVPARSKIDKDNAVEGKVPLTYKVKSYRCWTETSAGSRLSEGNRGTMVICEIIPTNITHKAFLSVPENQKPYVDSFKEYDVTHNGTKGAPITARAVVSYQYKE